MNKFLKALLSSSIWLYSVVIMLMMIMIVADVGGKYFFRAPIPGATEIVAYYMMVACVFLPITYSEAACKAIYVEIIAERLPQFPRRVLDITACVFTIAFYLVLIRQYWLASMHAFKVREFVAGAWNVTIWPSKFIIPIALTMAVIILIGRIWALANGTLNPDASMVEDPHEAHA